MSETIVPPEAWQQGYMEGKAEAQKTLRDEFAMAALQGMLAHDGMWDSKSLASVCLRYADAMLAERERSEDE